MALRLLFIRLAGPRALPPAVRHVLLTLRAHRFEAFAVGGGVRDTLLGLRPVDWDVATSAEPRYVMSLFPRTLPIGLRHGTVRVICPDGTEVDVTTYRREGPYSDGRRPDHVTFTGSLEDDLCRRDFTVNALALSLSGKVTDPYGGLCDLVRGVVRTVGPPEDRFREDALRMMRAVRVAGQLGFSLDPAAARAIRKDARLLGRVSVERIRDEFERCLVLPGAAAARALEDLRSLGLLERFIPELLETVGFVQNEHHRYTVWEHTLLVVSGVPPVLHLRLAALLHDVGKPRTLSVKDGRRHFFGHEKVGAAMAGEILDRLRYGRTLRDRVVHLVRHHMALRWQPGMKDAAVRRLINRVGPRNIDDLVTLRRADRRAAGTAVGRGDRETAALLIRVQRLVRSGGAFTVSDLAVDGSDVMRVGGIGPGPKVGMVLRRLLEEVLEEPELNEKSRLEQRIREMLAPGDTPRP